jgi:hypothetical protein
MSLVFILTACTSPAHGAQLQQTEAETRVKLEAAGRNTFAVTSSSTSNSDKETELNTGCY